MKRQSSRSSSMARAGLTVIEVVVIVIVVLIVVGLLLPMVRVSRGPARRMQCSNNLKQLILAVHSYESAYGRFPTAVGGTGVGPTPLDGNANRLSGLVALLPYLEQSSLYNEITQEQTIDSVRYPAFGPAPWIEAYRPWNRELSLMRCPSDKAASSSHPFGRTTYAFSVGDVTMNLHRPKVARGAFAARLYTTLGGISDGSSNTLALAEISNIDGRVLQGTFVTNQSSAMLRSPLLCKQLGNGGKKYGSRIELSGIGRGGRWADGGAGIAMVNTILPPGSASCSIAREAEDGIYSAASFHTGGINVAMVDGSVQFISKNIDCGDVSRCPPKESEYTTGSVPSPFGVWGALGSASGGDVPGQVKLE